MTTTMEASSKPADDATNNNSHHVRVLVRLRPLNEVETNRRSRTSVEIHGHQVSVSLEDNGDADRQVFALDGAFPSEATQKDVFEQARDLQAIPKQMLEGHNVCLVAYGPTATGKTHSLLGNSSRQSGVKDDANDGILQRLCHSLMNQLHETDDPGIEFTLRCSVVELYLERFRDLVHASSSSNAIRVSRQTGLLEGCTALSVTSADELCGLFQRAHATQTASARDPNLDSARSTLIVQLVLEQHHRRTGKVTQSRFHVVDCAASELAALQKQQPKWGKNEKAKASEPAQVAKGLVSLQKHVEALAAASTVKDDNNNNAVPLSGGIVSEGPVLTQLLSHSLGGANCFTTALLTASPSHYEVAETLKTLQFARLVRQIVQRPPTVLALEKCPTCHESQSDVKLRQDRLERVVQAFAMECLRHDGVLVDQSLAPMIPRILETVEDQEPLDFSVETKEEHQIKLERIRLKSEARRYQEACEEARGEATQLRSDLAILQAENAALQAQQKKFETELSKLRHDTQLAQQQKAEVEHNLRTSQFRENEAVVFARQFRRFYFRLLKKTAAEGTGEVSSIASRIPGAADLTQLVDLDRSMMLSGLLEEDEVGKDVGSKDYRPSSNALSRSTTAAEEAASKAAEVVSLELNPSSTAHLSIVRQDLPEKIEARQRLYQTPSGQFIAMREKILEEELLGLAEQCRRLQKQVETEQANVEALSGPMGVAAAFDKMRSIQEVRSLREELEQKDNDIKAVVLKWNELHMTSKTFQETLDNREQHVTYLEDNLTAVHNKNEIAIAEQQQTEKNLNAEISTVRQQLRDVTVPVWHVANGETETSRPSLASRLVLPFSAVKETDEEETPERRQSLGEIEELWNMDFVYASEKKELVDAEAQTDDELYLEYVAQTERASMHTSRKPAVEVGLFMQDDSSESSGFGRLTEIPSQHESKFVPPPISSINPSNGKMDAAVGPGSMDEGRIMTVSPAAAVAEPVETTTVSSATMDEPLSKPEPVASHENQVASKPISQAEEKPANAVSNDDKKESVSSAVVSDKEDVVSDSASTTGNKNARLSEDDIIERKMKSWKTSAVSSVPDDPVPLEDKDAGDLDAAAKKAHSSEVAPVDLGSASSSADVTSGENNAESGNVSASTEADTAATTTSVTVEAAKERNEAVSVEVGSEQGKDVVVEDQGVGSVDVTSESSSLPAQEALVDESPKPDVDSSAHSAPPSSENAEQPSEVEATPETKAAEETTEEKKGTSFMDRLRAKAEKAEQEAKAKTDDDDNTPEWMRKFKKIGAKNIGEEVIETSGAASAVELTRCQFGESLTHRSAGGPPEPTSTYQSTTKWTPRKKKDDDSDDDSWAAKFMGGSADDSSSSSSSDESDKESDDEDKSTSTKEKDDSDDESSNSEESASKANGAPSKPNNDSDSDDSSNEQTRAPVTKPVAVPAKRDDSDSNSAADEPKWPPPASAPAPAPAPALAPAPAPAPAPAKKKLFGDSDSEDSSDDESVVPTKARTSAPAPVKAKNDDSDSDSSDDESTVAKPPSKPAVAPTPVSSKRDEDSDSDSSDDESKSPPTAPAPAKKKLFGDSDSDSSDDESVVPMKARTPARASAPVQTKKDEADPDSSDDESTVAKPPPKPVAVAAPTLSLRNENSDSEGDSSDEESKAPPAKPASVPAKKQGSDSESSSDESKAPTPVPTPAKKEPPAESDSDDSSEAESVIPTKARTPAPAPVQAKKDDSDSDSSDDKSTVAKPPPKPVAVPEPEPSKRDEDSDSQETSSDEESKAPPAKSAAVPVKRDDSDSDSSDEESEAPAPAPTPAKKEQTADSDSEDSSDEETTVPPKTSTPTPEAVKTDESESESDESSVDEPVSSPVAEAEDSDESSVDEPPKAVPPRQDDSDESDESSVEETPAAAKSAKQEDSDSSEQSEDDEEIVSGAKSAEAEARRSVPDFSSQVTAGVTSPKKAKAKFVIKNGKLVKDDSAPASPVKKAKEPAAGKAKFVIKNGKLVKDDSFQPQEVSTRPASNRRSTMSMGIGTRSTSNRRGHTMGMVVSTAGRTTSNRRSSLSLVPTGGTNRGLSALRNSMGQQPDPKQERRLSLDSQVPDGKEERKKKKTSESSRAGAKKSGGNKPSFVIKNGKLVKDDSAAAKDPPPKKEKAAPAFSIVNGKLVKADGADSGGPKKKKKKVKDGDKKKKGGEKKSGKTKGRKSSF